MTALDILKDWNKALEEKAWRRRYKAHLASEKWARYRQRVLKRDNWRCTGCGDTQGLEVHHLTYERLGKERLTDCTTLCHTCHRQQHRRRRF